MSKGSELCYRWFRHSDFVIPSDFVIRHSGLRIMGNSTLEAPVPAIGSRLTLTIHDIAFGGEGVGRVDDFVIFVPFVAVGEEVEVEIIEVKKSFARARLLRIL